MKNVEIGLIIIRVEGLPDHNSALFYQNLGESLRLKAGFSSTGIYPFNPPIIPDYAFISDFYEEQNKAPIQPNDVSGSEIPERLESKSPQPGMSNLL